MIYKAAPDDAVHSPSIDALFFSLAKPHRVPRVGVLSTGMGRDGAAGLLAMRQSGAHTIAQDESTSVVYGMPKAAADLHAATEILPLPPSLRESAISFSSQTGPRPGSRRVSRQRQ